MTRTSNHSGTRTNRAARILRRQVADRGRRYATRLQWDEDAKTHREVPGDPDKLADMVELDRWAWPGGYTMLYVGHDGTYPLCQPCAQHDLEEDGEWPDGYDYVAGGPEDYDGRPIHCDGCGEVIEDWSDEA